MIKVIANGSKFLGQEPDTIEKLLEVLKEHPLNRTFEKYGDFISSNFLKPKPPGTVSIHGNFHTISHAFCIITDEPELIEKLTLAIRENQQRPDYLSQSA